MSLFIPVTGTGQASIGILTMDSVGDMVGFRWRSRSTTAIASLQTFCSAKSGGPRDISVTICADVNGLPSISGGLPVDIGGGTPTQVVVANSAITTGTVVTFTFTNAYTPAANTDYWFVINALSTGGTTWDASNRYQFTTNPVTFGASTMGELVATSTDGAGATWTYILNTIAPFSVRDGSTNYLPTMTAICPGSITGSVAFQASSNPDEYGNIWTVPANTTLDYYGLTYHYSLTSTTLSDHDLFAYTNPIAGASLLEQLSVDVSAYFPFATQTRMMRRLQSGPYALSAGQVVSATVRGTGTSNVTLGVFIAASQAAREASDFYMDLYGVTREGGSGNFTEQLDRIYNVVPMLAFAEPGGGPILLNRRDNSLMLR